MLTHYFAQGRRGGAWNGLCRRKECVIFTLTEVLGAKQFWQAHQSRAALGGFAHARYGLRKVCVGRSFAGHLNERNTRSSHKLLNLRAGEFCPSKRRWNEPAPHTSHPILSRFANAVLSRPACLFICDLLI